jgi:hypothetical protein
MRNCPRNCMCAECRRYVELLEAMRGHDQPPTSTPAAMPEDEARRVDEAVRAGITEGGSDDWEPAAVPVPDEAVERLAQWLYADGRTGYPWVDERVHHDAWRNKAHAALTAAGYFALLADNARLAKRVAELESIPFAMRRDEGYPDVPVLQPHYDELKADNARLRTNLAKMREGSDYWYERNHDAEAKLAASEAALREERDARERAERETCGCGKPVEYEVVDGGWACNKYARCSPAKTIERLRAERDALANKCSDAESEIRALRREVERLGNELARWEGESCGGDCLAAPCTYCDGTRRTTGRGKELEQQVADANERAEAAEAKLAACERPAVNKRIVGHIAQSLCKDISEPDTEGVQTEYVFGRIFKNPQPDSIPVYTDHS